MAKRRNEMSNEDQTPYVAGGTNATFEEMIRSSGISLEQVGQVLAKLVWEEASSRELLTSFAVVQTYLQASLSQKQVEEFHVIYLDRKNRLISDECMGCGTVDHVPVYPREVMKRALELNASAMVLAHNHPSGDPEPSKADIEMTKVLVAAAKTLDIQVHDHLVVGKSGVKSFRSLGLM